MKPSLIAVLLCAACLLLPSVHAQQAVGFRARFEQYKAKADQGDAKNQYEVGYCYEDGLGVAKDATEAVKWYRKAAEQGYPNAQQAMGRAYETGRGVQKDLVEAVKWYRLVAEDNYSGGQASLALCFALGLGVEKNEVEAYAWRILAAKAENSSSATGRDEYARTLTPQQIEAGKKRAEELRPQVLAGAEKRRKVLMAAANAELQAAREAAERKKASDDAKKASDDAKRAKDDAKKAKDDAKRAKDDAKKAKDDAAARALIPLPSRSVGKSTVVDFFGLIEMGRKLTPENATKLEAELKKDPKDIWARLLLIGHRKKGEKMPPECAELLLGLVEHHPREPGTGGIYIILSFLYDRSTLQQAVTLWEKHVAAMPKNAQVLGNAALWMMHCAAVDPKYAKESRSLFEKARTLEPKNPIWAEYVGSFLLGEARTLQPPERVVVAKQAIEHIEAAHRLRDEKSRATYQMMGGQNHLSLLADASFLTGETNKAKGYLIEMLQTKETKDWNYGNMVYYNNSRLGQIALSEGKPDEAAKYLLAAGKTPGSPQLGSFGPSFGLAKALLQLGRPQDRATVVAFLDDVARFWADPDKSPNYKEMKIKNREQIEAWKKEISDGKIPTDRKW